MNKHQDSIIQRRGSFAATNSVIRNTYALLALSFLFCALTAWFAMSMNAQPNFILFLVGIFAFPMLIARFANSGAGVLLVFAFTGFLGYMLAPTLNFYLHHYVNGMQLVMTAFTGTGIIFFVLSAYAFITRKDFSYMGGFLSVAVTVAFLAGLAAIFFQMPVLSLVVSGAFILLSSGYILFITSRIINDSNANYILATTMIFISLFNIFVNLLNILGAFGGRR